MKKQKKYPTLNDIVFGQYFPQLNYDDDLAKMEEKKKSKRKNNPNKRFNAQGASMKARLDEQRRK